MAGRSWSWMSRKWVLRGWWAWLGLGLESGCCCSLFVMGSDRGAIGEMRVRRGRREDVSIFVSNGRGSLVVDFS